MPLAINGIAFKSQKELKQHVQSMVNRYVNQQPLFPDDLAFMLDLLKRHPWADQKIGDGIKQMWIETTDWGNRGFWLERVDGSKTDFSWVRCVSIPKISLALADFKKACRHAIAPTIIAFRNKTFLSGIVHCEINGRQLNVNDSHVDHKPPNTFEVIINAFINQEGIDYNSAPITNNWDGAIGVGFTDYEFERKWINFHNSMAELRVISPEANLALTKIKTV